MIRRFCDLCGNEMDERNTPAGGRSRIEANLKRGNCTLTVEVITSMNGTSNAGDFCKHCIIDAFYAMDDRSAEMRRPVSAP